MSCNLCRGKIVKIKKPIRVEYLGVPLKLLNLERSHCTSCGEDFFDPQQAAEYSRAAQEQYAIKTRLTGADVLRIRRKLKLSQAEMETVLGLGKKVVVRWENEKVRLPGAVNALLKILDKRPEVLKFA